MMWRNAEPISPRTTSSACELRQTNTLELVVVVLSDDTMCTMAKIISTVLRPIELAHSQQRKRCKSCKETLEWYADQARGDFMEHLNDIAQLVSRAEDLETMGFAIGPNVSGLSLETADKQHPAVAEQNALASTMMRLAIACLNREIVSGLWHLEGYPGSCPALLHEGLRPRVMTRMKNDHELMTDYVPKLKGTLWRDVSERCVLKDMYCLKAPSFQVYANRNLRLSVAFPR